MSLIFIVSLKNFLTRAAIDE